MSPNNILNINDQPDDEGGRNRIVERVRALLAKADSTDHEPEREAFLAKAQQLITRYHIEQGELSSSTSQMSQCEVMITEWGNATRGVVRLYGAVAELNRSYSAHQMTRGVAKVIMFGTELDLELTTTLVDHLLPQLRHDILRDRPRSRMSYALGWANRVGQRLAEAQATEAAKSNSLVPTSHAAEEALSEAYTLRAARTTRVDGLEWLSGGDAAESVDIGNSKIGSS